MGLDRCGLYFLQKASKTVMLICVLRAGLRCILRQTPHYPSQVHAASPHELPK
jgi:hypothetical protein